MTRPRMAIFTVLSIAATLAGCGMNRRYANDQIRLLTHSNVGIQYNWSDSSNSVVTQSSAPPAGSDQRSMSIAYPHPNPKFGRNYAEVVLRETSKDDGSAADKLARQLVSNPFHQRDQLGSNEASAEGVIRGVMTRQELEFLLRDLVADSYFDREEREGGGVDLNVTLGSRTTEKKWDHIAAFDQLAERIKTENQKQSKSKRLAAKPVSVNAELLPPMSETDGLEGSTVTEPTADPVRF